MALGSPGSVAGPWGDDPSGWDAPAGLVDAAVPHGEKWKPLARRCGVLVMLIWLLAGLCTAALSASAPGQEIRGTIRDSATATPLPGAIAQLLDRSKQVVARALTGQDGRYRLASSRPASWLQVLRIGYRQANRELTPGETGDSTIDVMMARLPQRLEPVLVTQNANCPPRGNQGEAYALWDEVRAGLLATVVARETRPAAMRLIDYTRALRVRGHNDIDHQLVQVIDTTRAD